MTDPLEFSSTRRRTESFFDQDVWEEVGVVDLGATDRFDVQAGFARAWGFNNVTGLFGKSETNVPSRRFRVLRLLGELSFDRMYALYAQRDPVPYAHVHAFMMRPSEDPPHTREVGMTNVFLTTRFNRYAPFLMISADYHGRILQQFTSQTGVRSSSGIFLIV